VQSLNLPATGSPFFFFYEVLFFPLLFSFGGGEVSPAESGEKGNSLLATFCVFFGFLRPCLPLPIMTQDFQEDEFFSPQGKLKPFFAPFLL